MGHGDRLGSSGTRTLSIDRSTSTAHRLIHYDGVCGYVHGHNMQWQVEVVVSMEDTGHSNMPLDFKKVSDMIDETDHATLLNKDEASRLLTVMGSDNVPPEREKRKALIESFFGDVIWFESDPTCEVISQWMAERIEELDPVVSVELTLKETEKYGISTEVDRND